jgi:hypothetical protein
MVVAVSQCVGVEIELPLPSKEEWIQTSEPCEHQGIPIEVREKLTQAGLLVFEDGAVSWAAESPLHPRSWTMRRKLYDTGLIILFEFFT